MSEIDIREAIAARMQGALNAFTPSAIVLSRDVTGILESSIPNDLRDSNGNGKVHVWTITPRSLLPNDLRQGGTLYELVYDLTQIVEYRSGTNLSNSDREASLERDAIIDAFRWSGELPPILKHAKVQPVEFVTGQIDRARTISNGIARQSKAILRAEKFYGPTTCG